VFIEEEGNGKHGCRFFSNHFKAEMHITDTRNVNIYTSKDKRTILITSCSASKYFHTNTPTLFFTTQPSLIKR